MAKRRIETKTSRTAAYTCFSRACATREKDPHFRGPDYLAEIILPAPARFLLNISPLRKLFMHMLFGLEDDEIGPFLAARGFGIITHYTPSELEKIYLTAEDGILHGRINGTHCIVVAEVKNHQQPGEFNNDPIG